MLAKCQIGFQGRTAGLMPIIEREFKKAIGEQNELGNDAEYRFILFPVSQTALDSKNDAGGHV
eukprot:14110923-Ditylum_brightwellii.AAC.1